MLMRCTRGFRLRVNNHISRISLIDNIKNMVGIKLSNQIKSLLLSHHHSTYALVSEIIESVLQTVQKQFTYRQ